MAALWSSTLHKGVNMQLTQDLRDKLKEPVKKSWFKTYMDNRVLYRATDSVSGMATGSPKRYSVYR